VWSQPSGANSSFPSGPGVGGQTDGVAHLDHRLGGDLIGSLGAGIEDVVDLLARQSRASLAEGREALDDPLGEELLLVVAADLSLPAQVPVMLPIVEEELARDSGSLIRDNRLALRIFSGIQPTGVKHLGNYSGGFKQYATTQSLGEAFFCIVDLHSITVGYDPENLRSRCLDLAAMLFATGLDPKRSTVFVQSHVSAHPEAAWLLGAVATVGELRRMTQYKDKSATQDSVTSGLFTYPVLMAADILLYQTNLVPIGDDQQQHLELTRDIAQRFNARFGVTFTLPEGSYPVAGARIMDLQQPTSKMSTTGGTPQGTVLLVDPDDVVRRKVRTAVTDSGRDVRRASDKPGISNLIEIMSVASGEPMEAIERRFAGRGYGPFKEAVAEALVALIDPIRRRYNELRSDPTELHKQLALGAEKARSAAAPTLERMYERMGFVSR